MNHRVSFKECKYIIDLYDRGGFYRDNIYSWTELLSALGLQSLHKEMCWINSSEQKSYVFIVDERKWLIAKLKYGICF